MKPTTATYKFTETVKGKDGNDIEVSAHLVIRHDTKGVEIRDYHNHELVSLHVWGDFIKTVQQFAISELAKWDEPTQAIAPEPTPLFTSHDGKPIFEGDEVYFVGKNTLKSGKANLSKLRIEAGHHLHYIYFSSQEKADEYILRHTACLSLQDILNAWPGSESTLSKSQRDDFFAGSPLFKNFEYAVKVKLGMMEKPEPYESKAEALFGKKWPEPTTHAGVIGHTDHKQAEKDALYMIQQLKLKRQHFDNTGKAAEEPELTVDEKVHKIIKDIFFKEEVQPEHPPGQSESGSPLHFNKDATLQSDHPHPHAQPEWEVKGTENDKELAKKEAEMREKQRAFLKLVLKEYMPKEAAEIIADKYFMFVR